MNKYAIISIGSKQYRVEEGEVLEVQKLDSEAGTVTFDQVLLVVDGDKVEVGTPTVSGKTVTGTFVEEKKGEKIQVFKYKSKSKYRKMKGARQTYTYLKIDSIGELKKAPVVKAAKPVVKKSAAKKTTVKKTADK